MPRTDPAWKTASSSSIPADFSDDVVDGFILEVETEEGIGIGSTVATKSISLDNLFAQMDGPIRNILIGSDPFHGNAIRERFRKSGLSARATLAADLAINDLMGKIMNMPCHILWGGTTKSELSVVRMVGLKAPLELEYAVNDLICQGYSHFKIKVGSGVSEDVERIRRIRELFGSDIWISIDGNGAYTPEDAIALSHGLEPYDIRLIEQPIAYNDIDGMARVTAASDVPIMADQSVRDVASALEVCQRKAAHVVSVKLLKMGTVAEARRVTDICQAFGVGVHIGGTAAPAAVDAAQVQFAATMPWIALECEVGEFLSVTGDPLVGLDVSGGRVRLSGAPGLGVDLSWESTISDA